MTKGLDISGLDYNELQALIAEAQAQSEKRKAESLKEAVEAARVELEKRGFTIADLISSVRGEKAGKAGRKAREDAGKKVAPKYRDPANPANTWTGRGIKPKWLAEKIASGAKVEDFAI